MLMVSILKYNQYSDYEMVSILTIMVTILKTVVSGLTKTKYKCLHVEDRNT